MMNIIKKVTPIIVILSLGLCAFGIHKIISYSSNSSQPISTSSSQSSNSPDITTKESSNIRDIVRSDSESVTSSNSSQPISTSSSQSSNSPDITSKEPLNISDILRSGIKNITSQQVKLIKANTKYVDLIDELGKTADFGNLGIQHYLVDGEKLLVIKFEDLNDLCKLSGQELLSSAKSLKHLNQEIPEPSDSNVTVYGVITDEDFVSCIKDNDGFFISTRDAKISFKDGSKATEEDITPMSEVLITYDYMTQSYPGQIHCIRITIL